jgi:lactate permease
MNLILTLIALIPFILLFVLIIVKKVPAIKAIPLTWLITVIITLIIWKVSFTFLSASFLKAIFLALEIVLIIFGAVLLIEVLKQKKQIARIQAIIIAFFFGALIEGIAGFGTPEALAAPLLVSIGFAPVLAVVLSSIANSIPVSFGAAGTPILLGLAPLSLPAAEITKITVTTALMHSIAGFIIPIVLVYLVIASSKEKGKFSSLIKTLPFAIFSWLIFVIPYYFIAKYGGAELPSILAGLFGLIAVSLAAHYKFLTPKKIIQFRKYTPEKISLRKKIKSVIPYIIIILLLTITRIFPLIKDKISSVVVSWANILGTGISYSFLPLYTPSFYFIISALICLIFYRATRQEVSVSLKNSLHKIKLPSIALLFAFAFVQLLVISSSNSSGLPGIPALLAQSISSVAKEVYIFISPFIGAFGAFITGSNTVSNILFGLLQSEAAHALGISIALILSLQVAGGAAGNMIAIHNVIAANSVVGLKNSEGLIIRKTILVAIAYCLILGIVGFVLAKFVI